MRRWLCAVLLLCLLACAGCSAPEEAGGLCLYYPAAGEGYGAALVSQPYEGPQTGDPETLLRALLAGPAQEGATSPFPRGTTLQRCAWDPDDPGNLQVTLSEQYSELADVSLTLADYSIVLTLSQLDGVETVEITAPGLRAGRRSHQKLSKAEVELSDWLGTE